VIVPPKKNYIPQFLKQRDINSYLTLDNWFHPNQRNHVPKRVKPNNIANAIHKCLYLH
jgi:hypothetical protein